MWSNCLLWLSTRNVLHSSQSAGQLVDCVTSEGKHCQKMTVQFHELWKLLQCWRLQKWSLSDIIPHFKTFTLRIPNVLVPTLDSRLPRYLITPSPSRVKFWRVLEASMNVSENVKLIKYLFFRRHGNCSVTRCFYDICRKHDWKQPFYKFLWKLQFSSFWKFRLWPSSWPVRKSSFNRGEGGSVQFFRGTEDKIGLKRETALSFNGSRGGGHL